MAHYVNCHYCFAHLAVDEGLSAAAALEMVCSACGNTDHYESCLVKTSIETREILPVGTREARRWPFGLGLLALARGMPHKPRYAAR